MVDLARPQISAEFGDEFKLAFHVFKPRDRRFKIARIRQTVCADRTQIGQAKLLRRNFRKCSRALRRRAVRREISNRAEKRQFRPSRFR